MPSGANYSRTSIPLCSLLSRNPSTLLRCNAFEYRALAASFGRIYSSSPRTDSVASRRLAKCLLSCYNCFKKGAISQKNYKTSLTSESDRGISLLSLEQKQQTEGACAFGAPVFASDEVLKWNPFRDRIILTTAAIFFEGVESYRAITSCTGVESFFDLLIVNGSENLRKWKLLGSIDEIMNDFHNKNAKDVEDTARIPAVFEPSEENDWIVRCGKADVNDKLQRVAHNVSSKSDFSLHGPSVSSKDAIRLTGSNDAFQRTIRVDSSKKLFSEKLEWQPFQPGCIFQMGWSSIPLSSVKEDGRGVENGSGRKYGGRDTVKFSMADNENPITVSGDTCGVPDITVQLVDKLDSVPNCHLHAHCFQALQRRVNDVTLGEFDGRADISSRSLYSQQYLDAYKPKGKTALISPFLHCIIALWAVVPTLAFFVFLGWEQFTFCLFAISLLDNLAGINQLLFYSMIIWWSLATYFLIFCVVYIGIGIYYFLCVYLDFP